MTDEPVQRKNKTLMVLLGPTAIGKTSVAILLAKHFQISIISADSRQFYRELKIGTAAPTEAELAEAKHYFVGHLSIGDYYNVSRFEQDVLHKLDQLFETHHLVLMTGGSGLYIDAVCKGIDEFPDPDEELRRQIKSWYRDKGIGFLQEKLAELDPDYFCQVDRANHKRLMRAIEICLLTGQPYSSLRQNKRQTRPFNILKIGLNRPREELFEQISRRTDQMIEDGLVKEVRGMLPYKNMNALNTVGYKEIFSYLEGKMSLDEAIEKIKTSTRRYAKRQLTWFKRDEDIEWFLPEQTEQIIRYIESKTQ